MPIYEYDCPKCGHFEYLQSSASKNLSRCPTCRSKVTKLVSASSFHLKGGGWYADGYQKPGGIGSKEESKPSASSSPGSGSSKSDTKGGSTASKGSSGSSKPTSSSSEK